MNRKLIVLAACECARLTLPYVRSDELRPLHAIELAEKWAHGDALISIADLHAAAHAAYAAYAAADAADAAAYAAYAAAHAAYAAYAAADAYAAYADADAYDAADAAAYAAYDAAYDAAYAAYADAADAADARLTIHRKCCDIIRSHFYPVGVCRMKTRRNENECIKL